MMKPNKFINLLFFVSLSYTCWGQFTALNKIYPIGEYTILKDVISHDGSLTILAEVFDPLLLNEQNACLIRTDTFGNFPKLSIFLFPMIILHIY